MAATALNGSTGQEHQLRCIMEPGYEGRFGIDAYKPNARSALGKRAEQLFRNSRQPLKVHPAEFFRVHGDNASVPGFGIFDFPPERLLPNRLE